MMCGPICSHQSPVESLCSAALNTAGVSAPCITYPSACMEATMSNKLLVVRKRPEILKMLKTSTAKPTPSLFCLDHAASLENTHPTTPAFHPT